MIDQLKNMSLPLTGRQEAEDGRPGRTTIWQLPAGRPVRTGRLCRGVPGAACAAQPAGCHQGAAYTPDRPGGGALPKGSRNDCYADAALYCAHPGLRCAGWRALPDNGLRPWRLLATTL